MSDKTEPTAEQMELARKIAQATKMTAGSGPTMYPTVDVDQAARLIAEHDAERDAKQRGHKIRMVRDGCLAYCDRCHGGEIELETPCAERLEAERDRLQAELTALRGPADLEAMAGETTRRIKSYCGACFTPNPVNDAILAALRRAYAAGRESVIEQQKADREYLADCPKCGRTYYVPSKKVCLFCDAQPAKGADDEQAKAE